jgi:hypothetical protein
MKKYFNALFDTVKTGFRSLVTNGHAKYYDVGDNKSPQDHSNPLSNYFSEKFSINFNIQFERGVLWLAAAATLLVLSILICGIFKKEK